MRGTDMWDQEAHESAIAQGERRGESSEADGWAPLVRAAIFLGRALGANAMARAGDSARAKEARGGCGWPGGLGTTMRCHHRRLIDGTEKMGGEKEKSGRKFTSDEAQSTVELRLVVAEHGQGRLAALPGAESGVGSLATGELWRA